MKFNEWITAYSAFKKLAGAPPFKHWQDFYSHALTVATAERRQVAINQFKTESNWLQADRPYYSVWPKIIPMLIRLNLKKIDASWMKLPLPELCIRLPERDNPLSFDFQGTEHHIRCMLLSEASVNKTRGVCLWLDIGEVEHGLPVYSFYSFRCLENRPLQDEIDGLPKKEGYDIRVQIPPEMVTTCVRLCCTLCFLGNDPHLITPDVLIEDLQKFEATGDLKYVEKAKKRHKVGWSIGAHIEVSPHWRRPHFALYWVGKGRTSPVILPRKGAFIHKEIIAKMPTGKLGPEP
jgi:hypothetical protein